MKSMSSVRKQQSGLVSIMVTMIMLLVIALIVIGFTQITNRNSRQALDEQLSTQAFYAAESGVNQAIQKIYQTADKSTLQPQTNCTDNKYGALTVLSSSPNPDVAVTCLLVKPVTSDIQLTAKQGSSTIVPIETADANGNPKNRSQLTFTWSLPATYSGAANSTVCASDFSNGKFPQTESASCGFGVLRVDLLQYANLNDINTNGSSQKGATYSADNTVSLYLAPSNASSPVGISSFTNSNERAFIGTASCNSSSCIAQINFAGPAQNQQYFARVSSLYNDANVVTIDGTISGSPGDAYFKGIYEIDATGQAQDVFRRVQVRYNPFASGTLPASALQTTGDICKRFTYVGTNDVRYDGTCN